MKTMIRILAVMLLVVLVSTNTYADVVSEAEVLKKLNLISGTGEGYNLGGQLKRSEAATFIVKFTGMEREVKEKANYYSKSLFEDVESDAWYAPYVGYCHKEGIVSGFNDGTFRPEAYVSEKAFLTMLLQAMGYEADEDFDWNTVLQKAYETGLIEDISYTVRTEDNTGYIRGDVVHAMYNALDKRLNKENITVVERLVEKKVTNLVVAQKYDLIRVDEVVSKIESSTLEEINKLRLTFNEEIHPISKNDVKLMVDGKLESIQEIVTKGKDVLITFGSDLYEGWVYELVLQNITDIEGNIVEEMRVDIDGKPREVVESDGFLISSVNPISANVVEVYFTQPVDKNAEIELMYRFGVSGSGLEDGSYKNIEVTEMGHTDRGILIKFTTFSMLDGTNYELHVRGDLQSKLGDYLNDGEGDFYVFKGSDKELEPLEVTHTEIEDKNFILVEFNRALDEESAFDEANYKLVDIDRGTVRYPNRVYYYQDEEGVDKQRLMVRYSVIQAEKDYRLEIEDVLDAYKETRLKPYQNTLYVEELEVEQTTIDEVDVLDRSTLDVYFTRPLAPDAVNGYISIDGGISIQEMAWSEDVPNRLRLYVKKSKYLDESREYELQVEGGVSDYLDRPVDTKIEVDFDGVDIVRERVDIESARYISEDTILIKLTDNSRVADLKKLDRYELEFISGALKKLIYPSEVIVISADEVRLKFEASYGDGTMRIVLYDVYDYSGQYKSESISAYVERLED